MMENRRLPAAPAEPMSGYEPAEAEREGSPLDLFRRVHRLLRGRYLLTLTLAAAGALAGAAAGYYATRPKFQSTGVVRVQAQLPKIVQDTEHTRAHPLFLSFVQTQAALIRSPRVIDNAMAWDGWQRLGRPLTPAARERFKDALEVEAEPERPELILVRFADEDAEASQRGVEAVLKAYEETYGGSELIVTQRTIEIAEQERQKKKAEIDQKLRRIADLTREFATSDLGLLEQSVMAERAEVEEQLRQARIQLEMATAAAERSPAEAAVDEDWLTQAYRVAAVEARMYDLLRVYVEAKDVVDRLEQRGLGEGHRGLRMWRGRLAEAEADVRAHLGQVAASAGALPMAGPGGIVLPPLTIEQARGQVEALSTMLEELRDRSARLTARRMEVAEVQDQIARDREHLKLIEDRLMALRTEQHVPQLGAGRIQVISYGEVPTSPTVDHRQKLAALGFMFGGGLPVAAMVVIGLLDGRFRYCDDARTPASRIPLLGILPALPENMTDPEEASVAAHCVHQVRTLLQIAARDDGRRVFAVTSPTSGDGKTSLSLSLGLSFAASGAETLLIDFDLIGAGLTAALQAGTDRGVVHALDAGTMEGHVVPAGFPRLGLLPAGMDDAGEAGRLSPVMVARLLEQARRTYDVVIIDTGPVLGSLEAPLVCAEADGVVLAIGRGQQRSQTERAVEYLRTIGADVVGVVFNRARAGDFRRAMTSASVRSVPAAGGLATNGQARSPATAAALGPLGRTVASTVRP